MRYISALAMHFKKGVKRQSAGYKNNNETINSKKSLTIRVFVIFLLLFTIHSLFFAVHCNPEVIDRVVAYVDDAAITLSEFQENLIKMKASFSDITEKEVIDSMINRLLLIKEARKMRLEGLTGDELLRDYIDIKIRSSVFINEDNIRQFYIEHSDEFKGADYLSVRDEIEQYLFELEINRQLKKHIKDLRGNVEVRINLGH